MIDILPVALEVAVDRRGFNKSLLAAGWTASMGPASVLAAQSAAKVEGSVDAITRTGGETIIPMSAVKDFKAGLRGALILPGDKDYDRRRKVWNGMIDKHPGLIARCRGAADVVQAVQFAREFDLLVAVRGGGHSISGKATCDGGIMIDLSPMRWCRVDPEARTARLGGGSLLGDLDHETQQFGLATTAGTVSHTGAAGLTLGGGHGRLARSFGLTCDNVLSVDVVTADGEFIHASADENPDLYWGVRGGGGNFGVVTAFEYQLHPVGPVIYGGALSYPFKDAREIFNIFADFTADAPREMAADVIALSPAGMDGFVVLSFCYIGDFDEGDRLLAPIRNATKPWADHVGPIAYNTLQTQADPQTRGGQLYYNKSGLMRDLDPEFLNIIADRMEEASGRGDPDVTSNVIVQHLGGAVGDVPQDGTAYVHRDANFDSVILSAWNKPQDSERNITWLKDAFADMEPYTIGYYSNHIVESDQPKFEKVFRTNHDRMVQVKNKYDPLNVFQLNPNVKPTV